MSASIGTFAQDQKSLEARSQQMIDFGSDMKIDQFLDYTYPKAFTIVPRETFKEMLTGMMKGDGYSLLLIKSPGNFKFSPIKKIKDSHYAVVDYDLSMKMVYDDPIPADELEMMLAMFKEAMKSEDITYNPATRTLDIKRRAQLVAVADATTNNLWTFLNNDGGPLLGALLGEDVKKELGL